MRRPGWRLFALFPVAWLASVACLLPSAAHAQTVFKCQAGGQTIYQQTPCATNQAQQTIELHASVPVNGVAPMPVPDAKPVASGRDDADRDPPPRPPPRMYGCVRATDGKTYTSDNGNPQPYMAPFGVLGGVSGSLSDTYGNRNAAVASAPELNRGKGDVAGIATSNYVWVQDQCRLLSPAETCQALRGEADANQRRIRNAFKSERPPLDARDAELTRQLRGCR